MIFETLITGSILATVVYYRITMDSRRLRAIKDKWNKLMAELGLKTKLTNSTFTIKDVKPIINGFIAEIFIPDGLSFKDIEKHKDYIENSFCANIIINISQMSNICSIKFLNKELEDYLFKPVKTKEYELYLGKTYDGENYILSMLKNSHLLFTGVTGKGKTTSLMMLLTNLIYNSSDKIEIHLSQIEKSEVGAFRDCKCVKFYSKELNDVTLDLERVAKMINYRSDRFDDEGVANIQEYNKYNKNKPMKRIYYVLEELSFVMPQASEPDNIKELKERCWTAILEIAKAGRSVGIHLICSSQRSTTKNLSSDLKSQTTRISFAQTSRVDSQNVIESDEAIYLKMLQCLVYGDDRKMEIIKVPTLKEGNISLQEFVPEIRIPKKYEKQNILNKNNEFAGDTDNCKSSDNKVEKVFYEDRKVSDEELKEYYKSIYKSNDYCKKNIFNNTIINKTSKPGIIRGGAISVNKER